jgi:two-component system OmpR family response regulator
MGAMQILPKVLLVEDDSSIAGALAQALHSEYDIDVAATGKLALYKTDTEDYQIIVLDLHLPDISGINICQQLRERGVNAPILILSGESRVMTKINLLDAGANDYLTKPVSLGELKARLRAIYRYSPRTESPNRLLTVNGLVLDRHLFTVSLHGTLINLRRKEFVLLECLMENAGAVVTREALTRYVWQGNGALWTNTVDVHIKHLRDKIDRPFGGKLIRTVHGLGYKIEANQPVIAGKK